MKRRYHGWRRDRPDHRDYRYGWARSWFGSFVAPSLVDLTKLSPMPRVEDQSVIGSCVGNAATSAYEFVAIADGIKVEEMSRLFAYYACRVWIENVPPEADSGCEIRDMMKALARFGVCSEQAWPYLTGRFNVEPSAQAQDEARHHRITSYWRLPSLRAIRLCLYQGFPCVGGFAVPESVETSAVTDSGVIPYPEKGEQIVGGHAVMFVGYDDENALLKFANSWGLDWGQQGYGWLPYRYVSRGLASDFWTVRQTTR